MSLLSVGVFLAYFSCFSECVCGKCLLILCFSLAVGGGLPGLVLGCLPTRIEMSFVSGGPSVGARSGPLVPWASSISLVIFVWAAKRGVGVGNSPPPPPVEGCRSASSV